MLQRCRSVRSPSSRPVRAFACHSDIQKVPNCAFVQSTPVIRPSDSNRKPTTSAIEFTPIGPTDTILEQYPGAEVYDGRGKALLPGLINCHAHMAAVIARGFNEDFGFPNTADLEISPAQAFDVGVLFQGDPEVDLNANGTLSGDPTLQAELDNEADEIEDDLQFLGFYPVAAITATVRF